MRCARPHRLAALAEGRVAPGRETRLRRHLETCDRCLERYERVERARASLRDIGEQGAPPFRQDLLWARVRWTGLSLHRLARRRKHRRHTRWRRVRLPVAAAGAVALACGAIALWMAASGAAPTPLARSTPAPLTRADVPLPAVAPRLGSAEPGAGPAPLEGLAILLQGAARLDAAALSFDAVVGPNTLLETEAGGQLVVQFGADSAFRVGPDSTVHLRAFDERRVILDVVGTVDVMVSTRAPEQSFEVRAGDRRVVVRGTAFRVEHRGGELDVACGHGHVVVTDGDRTVDVRGGQALSVFERLAPRPVVTIPDRAYRALEASLRLPVLPVWNDRASALALSAPLEVDGPARAAIAVDGREIGQGSFSLRVPAGRHRIDGTGLGEWVDVPAGKRTRTTVEPTRRRAAFASADRAAQLDRALAERTVALRRCVARLDREGLLAGASVEFEMGINRDGSRRFLNIVETDLPGETAACLRAVLDRVRLPRGAAAVVRETLAF